MKKTRQCPKCGEFGLNNDTDCNCCKVSFIDKTIEIDIPDDFYKLIIKENQEKCQEMLKKRVPVN